MEIKTDKKTKTDTKNRTKNRSEKSCGINIDNNTVTDTDTNHYNLYEVK